MRTSDASAHACHVSNIRLCALGVLALYTVIYLFVYITTIVSSYGFLDDYTLLEQALRHQESGEVLTLVAYGRPLYALLERLVLPLMQSVADLRFLRIGGVLGIIVLTWVCHLRLCRCNAPRAVRIGLPIALGLMPAFQVYAAWAIAGFFPAAALLSGASFILLDWAPETSRPLSRLRFALAVVLLIAALCVYQPAAMFFWVFAAIAWFGGGSGLTWPSFVRAGLAMSVALAADFMLSKMLPSLLWGGHIVSARTELTTHPLSKVIWFVSEPLVNSLNLMFIRPSIMVACSVAAFTASGLWFFLPCPVRSRALHLAVAVLILLASYLPNLIVAEDWASYRTQVALTSLILTYAVFALVGWMRILRREHWLPIIMGGTILVCAISAARNVTLWFVLPQAIEYRMVESALDNPALSGATALDFYISTSWTLTDLVRYDEFGLLSSSAAWAPPSMAWLILHDQGSALANVPMQVVPRGAPPVIPGSRIIDLNMVIFGAQAAR